MNAAHPYREFEHSGWERAAATYAGSFEAATSLFALPLLEAVSQHEPMTLLDIACGTGYLAFQAAQRGALVSGVDFSKNMIDAARQRHPALKFLEADAEALPFADGAFDAVVINFGVHHFPLPLRALREAKRVLRSGGRIAFSVWASPDEHALHRITFDALREAGVVGAALPTPPGGAVNRIDTCISLLRGAGFSAAPPRAEKVVAVLALPSEQHLVDMLVDGTVRLSTLIRSQRPETVAAIIAAIRRISQSYRKNGGLRIPVTAILATATNGDSS
jgi:SAM-dependent methyltransferase